MKPTDNCYLCNSTQTYTFFELPQVPTQDGVMWPSKITALEAPKGNIRLVYCQTCGYIANEGYEQEKVTFDRYDFSLQHSPIFVNYIHSLAQRLIIQYNLKGKKILDVGCGDGHFLKTICQFGQNEGLGIDPGYKQQEVLQNIAFQSAYYTRVHADITADLVACRLVIDLLGDPKSFIDIFHHNFRNHPNTVLYFEVPNANYTFGEKVIWNIVYEHRSWFTPHTLKILFEQLGFEVLNITPCWHDEFLGIEVRVNSDPIEVVIDEAASTASGLMVQAFANEVNQMLDQWNKQVAELKESSKKSILWGAGARGVTFLNLFDLAEVIPFAVDINPKRHGLFIPGSGHEVKPTEFLVDLEPELIIISNPTYASEIQGQAAALGLTADFMIL